jgi:hypothetical protein
MSRGRPILFLLLGACAGGGEEPPPLDPIESWACLHVAEGELVDVIPDREAAETVAVGQFSYRAILVPEEIGFIRFDTTGPAELALLLDFPGAVHAIWNGDESVDVEPGGPNPSCDEDIVEVNYLSVPGGAHWLELGDVNNATVWFVLGET